MKYKHTEGKLKVVIDTNVIISAGISQKGNPAKIFELILAKEIQNYTSPEIISEIEEVFHREKILKLMNTEDIQFMIENFKQFSKIIVSEKRFQTVLEDPDDDKFLDCAVESNSDFIITGDPHLLEIRKFKNTKIITPKEFMQRFFSS